MSTPHQPLITALTTFYNLLASLRYIPADAIIYPPPGGHTNVDSEAALGAGFDDDAIAVMRLLPYLSEDVEGYLIAEETRPRSYMNTDDMGAPRNPASADEDLPSYALTLTATNVDGYALIYDTRTYQLTSLDVSDADADLEGPSYFTRQPFQPPPVLLGQWIKAFATLEWIPYHIPDDSPRISFSRPVGSERGSDDHDPYWAAEKEVYTIERSLKAIYADCGWNADAEEGEWARNFRGEEFEEKMGRWAEDVLSPAEQSFHERFPWHS